MFQVNDDLSIYVTRGDMVFLRITADKNGEPYTYQPGELVRFKVFAKKDCEDVVLEKDFPVTAVTQGVDIILTGDDTKIGDVISKPRDLWYEVELNPDVNPITLIGYDEDGAKVFKLFPEGADIPRSAPDARIMRAIDTELDMTSERPVQNQVIARAFANLQGGFQAVHDAVAALHVTPEMFGAIGDGVADDTAAFARMIESCKPNGRIVFTKNKKYVGNIYADKPLEIDFNGCTVVPKNKSIPVVNFSGRSAQTAYSLAQNAARGDSFITLTTSNADIQPGDVIDVFDSTARNFDNLPDMRHEVHRVQRVDGNKVYLCDYIRLPVKAETRNVRKLEMLKNPRVTNLNIEFIGDETGSGVVFEKCVDATCTNVDVSKNVGAGVVFSGCLNATASKINTVDSASVSAGDGYGVLITYGTNGFLIDNCYARNTRHGVDSAQAYGGMVSNCINEMSKGVAFALSHNGFDTDTTWFNCKALMCDGYAFAYYNQSTDDVYDCTAYNISIIDCECVNIGEDSAGIFFRSACDNCVVDNFKTRNITKTGNGIRFMPVNTDVKISNVRIDNYNIGIFIEGEPHEANHKTRGVYCLNATVTNCQYGVRLGYAYSFSLKNATFANIKYCFYFMDDDAAPIKFFTLDNILIDDSGMSHYFFSTRTPIGTNGVVGKISNLKRTTSSMNDVIGLLNDYVIADINQLYFRVSGDQLAIPIKTAIANCKIAGDPIALPITTGQHITLFNVGDLPITIPECNTMVFKATGDLTIKAHESVSFRSFQNKWVQL